jgi:small-conductance mechanosensitive channel
MAHILLNIFLSVIIGLIALGIGLLLRRVVVNRLKKTVLDNWLIQTLGVLVIFPPLIVAIVPIVIVWDISIITSFWSQITAGLQGKDITNAIVNLVWNIILSILIIALGLGIGRTVMKLVIVRIGDQRVDINIRTLLGRILYAIVVTVVIFWILSLWNVSISAPVTVIGALTVAFTFAIQDILKDLVAGLYILIERPFLLGDQITISTYTGKVENVQLRATRLRLVSGQEVNIPNSMVFGGIVVNNTLFAERRATINLSIPQNEFIEVETPEKILKIVQEVEHVLPKPEPTIAVSNFSGTFGGTTGASSGYTGQVITLILRFWIPSGRYATVTEVMLALHKALPNLDLVVEDSGGNV